MPYAILAVLLCAIEIGIAAFMHDAFVRPYLGDVLAVILVYAAIRAVTPLGIGVSIILALGTAFAIEFGQLFGLLGRLGLGDNMLARTVLGSGFDRMDFVAYAAGGVVAWVGERFVRRPKRVARR